MRFIALSLLVLLMPLSTLAQEMRPVTGHLLYRERMALPPTAEMLIELRGPDGAVLAMTAEPTNGAQVPLPFTVDGPVGPALTLRAGLRLEGALRWLGGPVEIDAGSAPADAGEVLLRAFRPMGFTSTLSCGELTAELGIVGQGARLRIGGTYIDLVPERTASGAKYVSKTEPGTWIWTKGDRATLNLNGSEFPECRAAQPGEAYIARGNEPGWQIEIRGGQMRFAGDYGATEIAAPLPEPDLRNGARRYAATAHDLVLTLRQALCHDDMTGMPYPASAVVETGGKTLRGCAGNPADLLTAHLWRVEDIGPGGIVDASMITLDFGPGGRLAGRGGCNRYTASYDLGGEGLSIGPAATTMMACPPALMEQERRFLDALSRVSRFDIAPDGALLLMDGGNLVLTARR